MLADFQVVRSRCFTLNIYVVGWRAPYYYFNFKFFEVFRIRVLVFISIYSFDNTFEDSIGEVIMNLIVRQVYHYSNFKFVEVFSVQVKFLVF